MAIIDDYRIRFRHLRSYYRTGAGRRRLTAIGGCLFIVLALIASIMLQPTPEQVSEPPTFSELTVTAERKEAFFAYFLPIILQRNQEITAIRQELQLMQQRMTTMSLREQWRVEEIAAEYGLEDFQARTTDGWSELLRRVDIVPPSLALAQAANESAWGTSRFALEVHNYYGHWCFVPGCGIVPAARPAGARHEVAAFESPQHSVERYMHNINSHEAYEGLRLTRARLRENLQPIDGSALVDGLERYSERGQDYINELRTMIQIDDLTRFDLALHSDDFQGIL